MFRSLRETENHPILQYNNAKNENKDKINEIIKIIKSMCSAEYEFSVCI
jgi:predicted site-specific integrase-resolvase